MNAVVTSNEQHMENVMNLHLNNLRTVAAQIRFSQEKFEQRIQPFFEQQEETTSYLGKRFTDSFREKFVKNCTPIHTFAALAKTAEEKVVAFQHWMKITPKERQDALVIQRTIDECVDIRTAALDALLATEKSFQSENVRYDHKTVQYVTTRTKELSACIKNLEARLNGQTYQKYIISGEEKEAFISYPTL